MQNQVRTLVALLQAANISQLPNSDVLLQAVTDDSRLVIPGTLFLAYPGETADGRSFIQDALDKGAVAVLCEQSGWSSEWLPATQVPLIAVKDLRARAGEIAAIFYGQPAKSLTIIGVTGTNGKTTTTNLIAQMLSACGHPCAVIGTLGYGAVHRLSTLNLTTPGSVALQYIFASLVADGFTHVAMEVSSHGLSLNRVDEVPFAAAIFTNLSQDHLDFHETMEAYGEAKSKLFLMKGLKHIILNTDDPYSFEIQTKVGGRVPISWYGVHPEPNFAVTKRSYIGTNIKLRQTGMTFTVKHGVTSQEISARLLGAFNASNILAAYTCLIELGLTPKELIQALLRVQAVPGRMERWGGGVAPAVVIDYAHTPDALEKALKAVREHCKRQVWCVFGCGGDRDALKRPLMGAVAERLADKVIITNDNPRSESPEHIAKDILRGMQFPEKIKVEFARRDAIRYALQYALPDDIILVAGKGHETTQTIGDQVLPFSDRQTVKEGLYEIHSIA